MFKKYREYLRENPEHYWFRAKWYGWGWTPATWEGWLVILVYLAFVFFTAVSRMSADETAPVGGHFLRFGGKIALATIILLVIIVRKGEKPGWHWGPPKKDDRLPDRE